MDSRFLFQFVGKLIFLKKDRNLERLNSLPNSKVCVNESLFFFKESYKNLNLGKK